MNSKPIPINSIPHFDSGLLRSVAEVLVESPQKVVRHKFFPFLSFVQHWTKFAPAKAQPKIKARKIRCACRRDSYIFSHYRRLLLPKYEALIESNHLKECIIGYRRIPVEHGHGNKCTIHFAHEAFEQIRQFGDCFVYALDIKAFFDSLDHKILKECWSALLGSSKLPGDHFAVYKAVTRHATVDKAEVYKALGLIGPKVVNGKTRLGYLVSKEKIDVKLCTAKIFQEKIKSLIETNEEPFGIPQGSSISDLLANLYMLDFDLAIKDEVLKEGGKYFRYSDDILLILPVMHDDHCQRVEAVQKLLKKLRLELKVEKTSVLKFSVGGDLIQGFQVIEGDKNSRGLEYLGFCFDGLKVRLRDSTLSSLYRRIARSARRLAKKHVHANPKLSLDELKASFNYGLLWQLYGDAPRPLDGFGANFKKQTFRSYVRRCEAIFGGEADCIKRQMRRQRKIVHQRAQRELQKLVT